MVDITKSIRAEADRAKFFADVIAIVEQYGSLDNAVQERKKALEAVDKSILAQANVSAAASKDAADRLADQEALILSRSAKAALAHAALLSEQGVELDASKEALAKIKKSVVDLDKAYATKVSAGDKRLAEIEESILVQSKKLEDIKAAITAIAGR